MIKIDEAASPKRIAIRARQYKTVYFDFDLACSHSGNITAEGIATLKLPLLLRLILIILIISPKAKSGNMNSFAPSFSL